MMKPSIEKPKLFWWVLGSISIVSIIFLIVAQDVGSSKALTVGNYAYPVPDPTNEKLMNNLTICDQMYNLGRNLPEYKEKVMDDEEYKSCLRALTTTPSDASLKLLESPMPTSYIREMRPRRVAGSGIIIYGITPRISPTLFIQTNAWYEKSGEKFIYVFGGAQRSQEDPYDFSSGAIVIDMISTDHQFISGGGIYPTPIKAGLVTIVDAEGEKIVLATADGHVFFFDLNTRSYINSGDGSQAAPSQREAGGGVIVQDGRSPFSGEAYQFENQWSVEKKGRRITVFAGQEAPFLGRGVVMVVESEGIPTAKDSPNFYFLSDQGAHFRIFEVKDNLITIVGRHGEAYLYDLNTRQFSSPIFIYPTSDTRLSTMEASFENRTGQSSEENPILTPTIVSRQPYP